MNQCYHSLSVDTTIMVSLLVSTIRHFFDTIIVLIKDDSIDSIKYKWWKVLLAVESYFKWPK